MTDINNARRRFIQQGGALSAAATVGSPLLLNLSAMADAAAAVPVAGDYKALVCVFMAGGNDAFGTVFPNDDVTWQTYQSKRGDLLHARDAYINISHAAYPTGLKLHPKLQDVATLYAAGKLSIVGNVGPLRAPTDRTGYANASLAKPPKLFSHNDQQSIWQTGLPEGAAQGWGGAALVKAGQTTTGSANDMFAAIGLNTSSPFLAATAATFTQAIKPYGIGSTGALPMTRAYQTGKLFEYFGVSPLNTAWAGSYRTLTHEMEKDIAAVCTRSQSAWQKLSTVNLAPIPTAPPGGALKSQLFAVAAMIKASGEAVLGLKRQVFFVQLGGFDTHADQVARHEALMAELGAGLAYFDDLLGADRAKVTTFTASDFGRKLTANGGGTDHGWGGHHFVMGGVLGTTGVRSAGGNVLGHFPSMSLSGTDFADTQMLQDGTMVPKVPITSYLEPMAKWFGVADFNAMWRQLDTQMTLPQTAFPTINYA